MTAKQLAKKIQRQFKGVTSDSVEFRSELTVEISDASQIAEVCRFAKEQLAFDYLVDLCTIDNEDETPRWTVVYHIYSYKYFQHLRLKVNVSEEESELPTVTSVWRTANWHEREAFDMMGIKFIGHPDLRRILMWEGYPYFPLRKDFPLAGKPSEMPDVAFTDPVPLEGGPFVTIAGGKDSADREPRVRTPE
ncbi:MAG: NADH-quinone oxidoreductase subunit C [Verrucomicrobiota bacterium]|nr:NADH-quinone oxidoreductase subunit C [Verrucomicrobiales bacterium]MEC7883008.1 NADH-quinone oxidoreductase subunit C [Verrucomicrobiota bacterium]MED5453559.1 NADH-quinone oxidoreductase subunit C [Verrucomicrobiota bacterium]|tara:strand:+ start:401 stop:976 length:576 start_codon:yes stop_codon:yes gene_type:complete